MGFILTGDSCSAWAAAVIVFLDAVAPIGKAALGDEAGVVFVCGVFPEAFAWGGVLAASLLSDSSSLLEESSDISVLVWVAEGPAFCGSTGIVTCPKAPLAGIKAAFVGRLFLTDCTCPTAVAVVSSSLSDSSLLEDSSSAFWVSLVTAGEAKVPALRGAGVPTLAVLTVLGGGVAGVFFLGDTLVGGVFRAGFA